jgi:HSP20 family protein
MKLVRWTPISPAREVFGLRDEMDRLFGDFFAHTSQSGDLAPMFAPPVDIRETAEEYQLSMDLPGVTLKDVKVNLVGSTLTIRGERRQEVEDKNGSVRRVERIHGSFERSFDLGSPVRGDGVKATYKDGVLQVRVPKTEEARVRQIEVQAG